MTESANAFVAVVVLVLVGVLVDVIGDNDSLTCVNHADLACSNAE